MLIGSYSTTLSPKRRLAIPSTFRKELGATFIISKWYEGCLVMVSKDNYLALLKKLSSNSEVLTEARRDTDRFILASSYEIMTDFQGRVIIPKHLADYAGLLGKVTFLGLNDRVEVWNEETWRVREEYIASSAGEIFKNIVEEK